MGEPDIITDGVHHRVDGGGISPRSPGDLSLDVAGLDAMKGLHDRLSHAQGNHCRGWNKFKV